MQRQALKTNGDNRPLEKLEETEKPEIHPLQTLRSFSTMNLELYTGLATYHLLSTVNTPELIKYGGFIGGLIGAGHLANKLLEGIVSYEHEKRQLRSQRRHPF